MHFKGLSNEEVLESRKLYGTNQITHGKRNTLFKLIIESLNDPIIKILLIALAIKILFFLNDSDIYETVGIIVAIILATVISSLSEYGSEKAFIRLSESSLTLDAKVYRNSKLMKVLVSDLVVGDIIVLENGDKIPADAIILEKSLGVDESVLTGESKEQYKYKDDTVYMGSNVVSGSAVLRVIKVGEETYYGKIAKDIEEKAPISPLKNRLNELAKFISKVGYICAFLVIISYLFSIIVIGKNYNLLSDFSLLAPHLLYSLTLGITIIVVAVPEGLPMMITLVLSSNMKKLIKNNVLVRKLAGIEAAGSLNILFSDKTGTITKGKLSVSKFIDAEANEYKNIDILNSKFKELVYISLVYNNSSSITDNNVIGGNTTDQAILTFVGKDNKDKYNEIKREEFDSKKKYSSVTINYEKKTIFYKGAYEIILSNCSYVYKNDASRKLIDKKKLEELAIKYTKEGYRVLAMATGSEQFSNLSFIGFIVIKDEIRKEAIEGIKMVKEAGVQTVMITGDNILTAKAIAKEAGLIDSEKDVLLTSEELSKMTDEEVKSIIPKLKVVARSLPTDKKRLVVLSQELNLVTGMTGDGVNDSPALKRADVGFAMGSGSDVAKEVSDIILLDDNFLSIAKTILFGRTIFKSIRKFIIFQLTVNITAVSLSVIGPLFKITSPITTIQMLWINMIMDTLAGIAYSFEPPLKEYMKEKPKDKNEKIMNSYMVNEILVTGIYMSFLCLFFLKSKFIEKLYRFDMSNKYLMTAFFALFIFMCVFNAFNARTYRLNILAGVLKNKVFLSVIVLIVTIQLIMIYFGGSIFRTTGLSIFELNITLLISFSVIPFDFIRKKLLKLLHKNIGV